MPKITIDGLDDALMEELRKRANVHGRSVDKEVLDILRREIGAQAPAQTAGELYDAIRKRVEPLGGIEIDLPPREPMPEPPKFD